MTGRISDVFVDEGETVTKNKVLASLDIEALEARKTSLEASLAQADAILEELKSGPRQEKIESMIAQLAEADSNLKLAKINFDRRKQLGSAISQEEYDRAEYAKQSAAARVDSISKQLQELKTGTRPEKIKAQEAACQQLKSSIAEVDVEIGKSSLRAPFDGKIVRRQIDCLGEIRRAFPAVRCCRRMPCK